MAICTLIVLIVGACLSRPSFSLPVSNTEVNARDSLPNLLAAVLSARNGGRNVIASPHHQKRIQDSKESFEVFRNSHRIEPLMKMSTKSTEFTSSKPVYFDQGTFSTVNNIPKRKIQQKSNPDDLPLFLVLRNYSDSSSNNILSKKHKSTNIQDDSDHIANESGMSLFLPVIFDDDDNKQAEFRRLSIPSQLFPGFKHSSNLQPVELVEDLHGYVFDVNKQDSQNLISFLKQSTLESLESRDRSSSSEEEYLQGIHNKQDSQNLISFLKQSTFESLESRDRSSSSEEEYLQGIHNTNSRGSYSEEDYGNEYVDGGEQSSEEINDLMRHVTTRKKQGVFATSGSIFLGSPAIGSTIVPTYPHQSLTVPSQKINIGQITRTFPSRTRTFHSAISSKEKPYEDNLSSKNNFHLPTSAYKVKTQAPNYDPISSVRSLSQTLSSEFVRRVPKINTFPSSPHSLKSTSGVGNGSIRLIPSILYTDERVNHGISGVLGLGQPVSVGLLQ